MLKLSNHKPCHWPPHTHTWDILIPFSRTQTLPLPHAWTHGLSISPHIPSDILVPCLHTRTLVPFTSSHFSITFTLPQTLPHSPQSLLTFYAACDISQLLYCPYQTEHSVQLSGLLTWSYFTHSSRAAETYIWGLATSAGSVLFSSARRSRHEELFFAYHRASDAFLVSLSYYVCFLILSTRQLSFLI